MQLEENRDIRDRDAPAKHGQLCAVIREERAEELASAGMGSAARKRRAMAVLKSALTMPDKAVPVRRHRDHSGA